MAGFSKEVVVAVLEEKLADAKAEADSKHQQEVEIFKQRRDSIQRAKANTRQAVRDLQSEKITVEEFAVRLNVKRDYHHWFTNAHLEVGVEPKRKPSAQERAFDRVIRVIKSNSAETLTVTEMRSLGVLEFVKFG